MQIMRCIHECRVYLYLSNSSCTPPPHPIPLHHHIPKEQITILKEQIIIYEQSGQYMT